jgi:hypothetical protein
MSLAPIVLFTYKRLTTLQQTVGALAANFLAEQSDLIIYSDGPKKQEDEPIIQEIRMYLQTITGFKSLRIHESTTNKGLANSIITGVSEVMAEYHKAIVLEDDLITSTNFLDFMNAGLNEYEQQKNVYSISGYAFDFKNQTIHEDAYFLNRSWPWGWATWEDRWTDCDWNLSQYKDFSTNKKARREFSSLGSDVNAMLRKQWEGDLDSWSIRWIFHIFQKNGYVLYPTVSKVDNNGWDFFATHTNGRKNRYITPIDTSNNTVFNLPLHIKINERIQRSFQIKMGFIARGTNKFVELLLSIRGK